MLVDDGGAKTAARVDCKEKQKSDSSTLDVSSLDISTVVGSVNSG